MSRSTRLRKATSPDANARGSPTMSGATFASAVAPAVALDRVWSARKEAR